MNFGQGLMTCAVFGLESKYVFSPLLKWLKKVDKMYKKIRKGERIDCNDTRSLSLKCLEQLFRTLPSNRVKPRL